MHVAAKIGLAMGGGALTAGALYGLSRVGPKEGNEQQARTEGAAAAAEWKEWKGKLESEFPGRRLDTPADHARFERFLEQSPAPSWIKVEHEDFTKFRLTPSSPLSKGPSGAADQGNAYVLGFGGFIAAGGAYGLYNALAGAKMSTLGMAGLAAGAGAAMVLGVGGVLAGIDGFKNGDKPYQQAYDTTADVREYSAS